MGKKSERAKVAATTASAADVMELVSRFLGERATTATDARTLEDVSSQQIEIDLIRKSLVGEIPPKIRHPEAPTSRIVEGLDLKVLRDWRELVTLLDEKDRGKGWAKVLEEITEQEAVVRDRLLETLLLDQAEALRARRTA